MEKWHIISCSFVGVRPSAKLGMKLNGFFCLLQNNSYWFFSELPGFGDFVVTSGYYILLNAFFLFYNQQYLPNFLTSPYF